MDHRNEKITFFLMVLYLCVIPLRIFATVRIQRDWSFWGFTRPGMSWPGRMKPATKLVTRSQRSVDGGAWTDLTTLGPQAGYPRHVIDGANPSVEYRYRLRAQRSTDNTNSLWSNIARDPDWVERANIRVFYNTTVCLPGNCVPATTNALGENEMAARMADLLEGTLSEYQGNGIS